MQDDEANLSNAEIGKREKARLRDMQNMKRQKVQEILDAQNAAIEADMVSALERLIECYVCTCYWIYSPFYKVADFFWCWFNCRTIRGRDG